MLKYITISLVLVGCGQAELNDHIKQIPTAKRKVNVVINPDFNELYTQFKTLVGVDPHGISIDYKPLELPTVGVCYSYSDNVGNYINIDRDYWDTATDLQRQELVFHELGHCVLDLGHNETTMLIDHNNVAEQVPVSIMYPVVFGNDWYYEAFKEYYYKQLSVYGKL